MTHDIQDFEPVFNDAVARIAAHIGAQQRAETPASGYAPLRDFLEALDAQRWIREGGMDGAQFSAFLDHYLKHSVQLHHPMHIAHQVAVPDYPAALAEMITGFMNNPMAVYEMGPSAAALEFVIVNWMLEKIGWQPRPLKVGKTRHGGGVLTHGGSLANLTCLLAARAAVAPDAWRDGTPHDLVVLAPALSHYSVERAVAILGLGADAVRPLPAAAHGVVDPAGVRAAIESVEAEGQRCMAVIANACATATGLHDPLREIGAVCQDMGVWFHVDGCHGASALLDARTASFVDGIELSDSVVWDAHKMLQVPALCAAALFRDDAHSAAAFQQAASYLAYGEDVDSYDSLPRAVECTKSSLALKLFMNLAWRGEAAMGDFVHARYAAAREFAAQIAARPGFEVPFEPESNILMFRFGDDDALMVGIRDAMVRRGEAHITSAEVGGTRWLRLTVMNPLTQAAHIDALLDLIERTAQRLAEGAA